MWKPHILEYEAAINDQTQFSVIDETISQGKDVDRKISSNMKLKSLIPSSACATTACMDQSGTDGSPASDETTTVADQGPPITEFRKYVNIVWCDFESEKLEFSVDPGSSCEQNLLQTECRG